MRTFLIKLKVVVFDDKDYDFAKMIHHRYPDIPFYLLKRHEKRTKTRCALVVTVGLHHKHQIDET